MSPSRKLGHLWGSPHLFPFFQVFQVLFCLFNIQNIRSVYFIQFPIYSGNVYSPLCFFIDKNKQGPFKIFVCGCVNCLLISFAHFCHFLVSLDFEEQFRYELPFYLVLILQVFSPTCLLSFDYTYGVLLPYRR